MKLNIHCPLVLDTSPPSTCPVQSCIHKDGQSCGLQSQRYEGDLDEIASRRGVDEATVHVSVRKIQLALLADTWVSYVTSKGLLSLDNVSLAEACDPKQTTNFTDWNSSGTDFTFDEVVSVIREFYRKGT